MKHLIVSCTKNEIEDTLLYKSCKKFNYELCMTPDNRSGLSYMYNYFIREFEGYDSLIFIHDDVEIDDPNLYSKLDEAYKHYDIVGLAGGLNPTIKEPALWHLMIDPRSYRGVVGHIIDGKKHISNFGTTPSRVTLIDGLFMAVNLKAIKDTNWSFDEDFTFHMYDLDACITANDARLKIGVWPISVYHASPGLRDLNDKCFRENQAKFLKKHS